MGLEPAILTASNDIIGVTRSEQYREKGIGFTQMVFQAVGADASNEAIVAGAGVDLAAINSLYEQTTSDEQTAQLTKSLNDAAQLEFIIESVEDLLSAVLAKVSWMTLEGYTALAEIDEERAQHWLSLWQAALLSQNIQEQMANDLAGHVDSREFVTGIRDSIEYSDAIEVAKDFLARFGEKGAMRVAMIAAIPSIDGVDTERMDGINIAADVYVGLMRLAQDIRFDKGEKFNLGIDLYAVQHNMTFADAQELLSTDEDVARALQSQLEELWLRMLTSYQVSMANLQAEFGEMNAMIMHVAQALTSNWKG